ncbi:hypothetical protein HDV05_004988 [Chytridiales sp. JEL 0842]|nr:hypothetical protein HDV05_004988 [Chytridiales sp. JEL 0842]
MGESRTELLAWLNDLAALGYTKVEQCGTGAAHCVIIDSIYRDVNLSKVKFGAKHEYEYVHNMKVLQAAFDKHKIDQHIPVERLIKCKFQDNLEFLQWMKKYWDQYYPGGQYDALARRKGDATGSVGSLSSATSKLSISKKAPASPSTSMKKSLSNNSVSGNPGSVPKGPTRTAGSIANRAAPAAGASNISLAQFEREKAELESEYQKMLADVNQQNVDLKLTIEQVEKEREFYFSKLREIEIYIQSQSEAGYTLPPEEAYKQIQDIMYRTEEGFEAPTEAVAEVPEGELEMY